MDDERIHLSPEREDTASRAPWESLFLAYAAMLPIAAGALAVWLAPADLAALAARATLVWAGAIVCFLAGVRRGLSFRQERGPLLSQLAGMLWLFALGFVSLVVTSAPLALGLQILAFASIAVLDPLAAKRGEAPVFFAGLRPVQMAIPLVSLGAIWLGVMR